MFGISIGTHLQSRLFALSESFTRPFSAVIGPVRQIVQQAVARTRTEVVGVVNRLRSRLRVDSGQSDTAGADRLDRWRQALNLLLSVGQLAASVLSFSILSNGELFQTELPSPLLNPASYTFIIWSLIFPTSILYGIFQALPGQRTNPLLRRIGWPTAFAFFCITLWSPLSLVDPVRLTVPLFFGALWGLIYAVYHIGQLERPLTRAEQLLVAAPLGVYAAWSTVGTIANATTSLYALGYTDPLIAEQYWAVILLLIGTVISTFMTRASQGNVAYAAGIIWAFGGIVVANVVDHPNRPIALTAAWGMLTLAVTLWYARMGRTSTDRRWFQVVAQRALTS